VVLPTAERAPTYYGCTCLETVAHAIRVAIGFLYEYKMHGILVLSFLLVTFYVHHVTPKM
jgi:hypothetical protein